MESWVSVLADSECCGVVTELAVFVCSDLHCQVMSLEKMKT